MTITTHLFRGHLTPFQLFSTTSYKILGLLTLLFLASSAIAKDCQQWRTDVMVLFNLNSPESLDIARDYVDQRCINPGLMKGILAPVTAGIDWQTFSGINNQLIRYLISTIPESANDGFPNCPDPEDWHYCQANIDYLRTRISITTLVLIKGMPTRVIGMPPANDNDVKKSQTYSATLDHLLRFSAFRLIDNTQSGYYPGVMLSAFVEQTALSNLRLQPHNERAFAVGRIDGLDKHSAMQLVRRAIQAEKSGLSGNWLWDNANEPESWFYQPKVRHALNTEIPVTDNRYITGITGDTDPLCLGIFPVDNGVTPSRKHCKAQYILNNAKSSKPGFSGGNMAIAYNAQVYAGHLDNQAMYWPKDRAESRGEDGALTFSNLLNWQKDGVSAACRFCKDTADPAACRLESTDALREIDTNCAGVAEGFIGFNYQSYPVSYMMAWPTGWGNQTATAWNNNGSGENIFLASPQIKDNIGFTDTHSLWFNTDVVVDSLCMDNGNQGYKPCDLPLRKIRLQQRRNMKTLTLSDTTAIEDRTFSLNLKYQYHSINDEAAPALTASIHLRKKDSNKSYVTSNDDQCSDFYTEAITLADTGNDWATVTIPIVFDVTKACYKSFNSLEFNSQTSVDYDGIKLFIGSRNPFSGKLGIDDITLTVPNQPDFTLINSSFDQGFLQSSTGDHASLMLSRLNGTAFWGNTSHFYSNVGQQKAIIAFKKGTPLGEAVWMDSHKPGSTLLYGDPLYNPIAVRIDNIGEALSGVRNSTRESTVELTGSAFNGADNAIRYTLAVCEYTDFYQCDIENRWDIQHMSTQKKRNASLGTITLSFPGKKHLVRLSVTADTLEGPITYNDFMHIDQVNTLDYDGNNVPDDFQLFYGHSIGESSYDSDNDGITDILELYSMRTADEKKKDQAAMAAGDTNHCMRACRQTRLALSSFGGDSDNDGFSDYIESQRGTLALDPDDKPQINAYYVDTRAITDGNNTVASPLNSVDSFQTALVPGDIIIVMGGDITLPKLDGIMVVCAQNNQQSTLVFYEANDAFISRCGIASTSLHQWVIRNSDFKQVIQRGELSRISIVGQHESTFVNAVLRTNMVNFATSRLFLSNVTLIADVPVTNYNYFAKGYFDDRDYEESAIEIVNSIIEAPLGSPIIKAPGNALQYLMGSVNDSIVSHATVYGVRNIAGLASFANADFEVTAESISIDAGTGLYAFEPEPNGGRLNAGAYGNTPRAQTTSD